MRTPVNKLPVNLCRSGMARILASAVVILSLTACDAETLALFQSDLADGDDVNVNLSTDDEGNIVVSIADDDTAPIEDDDPTLPVASGGVLFDESVDGEITGDATNPLALDLANGSNVVNGTVVGGDIDYVTVNVPEGHVLSAIDLLSYESIENTQSFIGIQAGTIFTEPPVDTVVGNLLGFTLFGVASEGSNILPAIGSGEGAQGFTTPLAAGDYTFWIQETGPNPANYSLDMVVSPEQPAGGTPAGDLTVTLTNTSSSQPMTPPVVLLHNAPAADNGMRLFFPGQPAIDQLVAIAEDGNSGPMVELIGYLVDQGRVSASAVAFADPANPGPLLPGMSATVDLDLASEDQVMSIVSMVVCTNDGFSGADSHVLSSDTTETFLAPIYDAGSETNVLSLDYWVPPCGSDANITDDENGSITLHPGQSGSENPVFDFAEGSRFLEVTITRN